MFEIPPRLWGQRMPHLLVCLRPAGEELPFPRDVRFDRGKRLDILLGADCPSDLEENREPLVLEKTQREGLDERVVEARSEARITSGDVRRDREGACHHERPLPRSLPQS